MDSLHSWKTRFRKTFYWKNTRNGQNHARRRLPWEAFETTSYNRNLCNFHTKRWLHLVTIVNDNISDTKTIHGPRKTLQIPQKKRNPFQVCPRKIVKTHARKNVRRDEFERAVIAPSHLLSKCQKLRARAWSLWILWSEQKSRLCQNISKQSKPSGTITCLKNSRETFELKLSCTLCQQALEPCVFQTCKSQSHDTMPGGNPPKGLENVETASTRTARCFVCNIHSGPTTHRHRSSLYPFQRAVSTNKIKTIKTFQAKKNKTWTQWHLRNKT